MLSAQLTVLRLVTTIWAINFQNVISSGVECTGITNPFPCSFDGFAAYYNCMSLIFKLLISPWLSADIYHKSCSELNWPFYGLLQHYEQKLQKSHIYLSSVHKYHKSCSLPIGPFFRLVRTVWVKTFKISYLQESSAQVSQIVFPAHLTVLRVITTVWIKTSKMSYLRDFSVQIS